MKRVILTVLIAILTCLFCVCIYIYFCPPIPEIQEIASVQTVEEGVALGRKLRFEENLMTLGAALMAKFIIFMIVYCARRLPMYKDYPDYYSKLEKSLRYLQWILNGLAFAKLLFFFNFFI